MLCLLVPATAAAVPRASEVNPPCGYTQAHAAKYLRAVYKRATIERKAKRRIARLIECQHSKRARKNVRKLRRVLIERRQMRSLTPYPGPNGTHWAIPYSIVACESGGSWSAYNPSGATGPYQLLGKGVSLSDPPIVHHRVAAALWAGGRGASHWVCKR